MRTPVVLLTGVDPDAVATVAVGLLWDLPRAVAVHHRIDVERSVLQRTVSDATGVVDEVEVPLDHACVTCAVREDVLPTLHRVATDGRWETVVAQLPVGAAAEQVCTVVHRDVGLASALRVASVVAALEGTSVVHDLLGDDLLRERGLGTSDGDARGVGEVGAALVERADVVVLTEGADPVAVDLVRELARPDAVVVEDSQHLLAENLVGDLHDEDHSQAWVHPQRREPLLHRTASHAWSLDLRSDRPFHPGRLLRDIARLGSGQHRSRGCFWLPTRPDVSVVWDGAGGQLGIGTGAAWGAAGPMTRIVVTGIGRVDPALREAFDELLLDPEEPFAATTWEDGFEAWLGPVLAPTLRDR